MFVTVTYDIADDRRRARVARLLEDYGVRVQYSVFDCLLDERRLLELRRKLQDEIDQSQDSVRFYTLCRRCRGSIDVMGAGRFVEDRDILIL